LMLCCSNSFIFLQQMILFHSDVNALVIVGALDVFVVKVYAVLLHNWCSCI